MFLVFFIIAFVASFIGVLSGLGGGIIIKPVLDMTGIAGVAEASFMSGLTVLAMTLVNLIRNLANPRAMLIDKKRSPWLALGAVFGGLLGNKIFAVLMKVVGPSGQSRVGAIQAAILFLITVSVMAYMHYKARIRTKDYQRMGTSLLIGLSLGMISSFLGIGGGPMNLVVLYFFFSMSTKEAAQNSLFIIFFSQLSSLLQTLFNNTVPDFNTVNLIFMIIGGVSAGIIGGIVGKRMDDKTTDKMLMAVFTLIALINVYNFIKFLV
jgi:uncharacterized membrane protein YfcA